MNRPVRQPATERANNQLQIPPAQPDFGKHGLISFQATGGGRRTIAEIDLSASRYVPMQSGARGGPQARRSHLARPRRSPVPAASRPRPRRPRGPARSSRRCWPDRPPGSSRSAGRPCRACPPASLGGSCRRGDLGELAAQQDQPQQMAKDDALLLDQVARLARTC